MAKTFTYHFVYKTVNTINNKFYIGKHSTNNIDDGYLGSGSHLNNSIEKYGVENFARSILQFFKTSDEAFEYEKQIVNKELLKNPLCMNMCLGGKYDLSRYNTPCYQEKRKRTIERNRLKAKQENKPYGITREKALIIAEEKRKRGIWDKLSKENRGNKNPSFKIYEENLKKDMNEIFWLIKNTNIPTKVILSDLFLKKSHIDNLFNYYISQNLCKKITTKVSSGKFWSLVKTQQGNYNRGGAYYCVVDNTPPQFECSFLISEYFDQIERINEVLSSEVSDSQLYNKSIGNSLLILQSIEYFEFLGCICNKKIITIRVKRTGEKNATELTTVPSKKTIFEWNFKNLKKVLIDKELNIYGIDDNGKPFQKGKLIIQRS